MMNHTFKKKIYDTGVFSMSPTVSGSVKSNQCIIHCTITWQYLSSWLIGTNFLF